MSFRDYVALETERHMHYPPDAAADRAEAFRAFVEKRVPVFRG
jgi:hypothetical protein